MSNDLDKVKRLIDKAIPNGDCLECHLKPGIYGYCMTTGGVRVHRLVYKELVCDPGDMLVLHRCDNRRCINPEHLFHGTQKDNMDDMASKGRKANTTGNTRALTLELAQQVYDLHKLGESTVSLARKFNVSQSTICNVIHGKKGYADVKRFG